jgi:hypothetical protein
MDNPPTPPPDDPTLHPVFMQPMTVLLPFHSGQVDMESIEVQVRARWKTKVAGIQLGWRNVAVQPGVVADVVAKLAADGLMTGVLSLTIIGGGLAITPANVAPPPGDQPPPDPAGPTDSIAPRRIITP